MRVSGRAPTVSPATKTISTAAVVRMPLNLYDHAGRLTRVSLQEVRRSGGICVRKKTATELLASSEKSVCVARRRSPSSVGHQLNRRDVNLDSVADVGRIAASEDGHERHAGAMCGRDHQAVALGEAVLGQIQAAEPVVLE